MKIGVRLAAAIVLVATVAAVAAAVRPADGAAAQSAGGAAAQPAGGAAAQAAAGAATDAAPLPLSLSPAAAVAAIQQAELTAPDGGPGSSFGGSVAISGDTALVGDRFKQVGDNWRQGAAYVFVRNGSTWTLQARLTAADGHTWDCFGASVALSGDVALIGAPYDDQGPLADCGSAYVFTRSGAIWTQRQRLAAVDGTEGDRFGADVAIAGDNALVGVPGRDVGGNVDQGRACPYLQVAGVWSARPSLLPVPAGAAGDAFGTSVALSGDTAIVGAMEDDIEGSIDQGSAHVFVREGLVWSHQVRLLATGGAASERFGWAVAISGDTALVGAPFGNDGKGEAHVFVRSGTRWTQPARLTAPDGAPGDGFGLSVALDDGVAVVGTECGRLGPPGAAHVFAGGGAGWAWRQKLTAGDAAANDHFGSSVSVAGETALVGSPNHTVGANPAQGAAYAFLLDGPPVTTATVGPSPNAAGWNKTAVTVMLNATDELAGVAYTEYRAAGAAAWTPYAAPFTVSTAGATSWEYRSADTAGAVEATKTLVVRIGKARPVTKAFKGVVKKGKRIRLRFKVKEPVPGCDKATVTLKVFKGKRLKKTLRAGVYKCNVKKSYRWRCTLKKGRYTMKVYATDLAGNKQRKVGSARLTVK
jgi:hypothetical protein